MCPAPTTDEGRRAAASRTLKWQQENRGAYLEYRRAYYARNRDRLLTVQRARRATGATP
jgi:hypothetical protein